MSIEAIKQMAIDVNNVAAASFQSGKEHTKRPLLAKIEQLQAENERLRYSFGVYVKKVTSELHNMSFEKMTTTINQCHQNIKTSTKFAEQALQGKKGSE